MLFNRTALAFSVVICAFNVFADPIHEAVEEGDFSRVIALASAGASLDAVDEWGRTPLIIAKNNAAMVALLVELGAGPGPRENEPDPGRLRLVPRALIAPTRALASFFPRVNNWLNPEPLPAIRTTRDTLVHIFDLLSPVDRDRLCLVCKTFLKVVVHMRTHLHYEDHLPVVAAFPAACGSGVLQVGHRLFSGSGAGLEVIDASTHTVVHRIYSPLAGSGNIQMIGPYVYWSHHNGVTVIDPNTLQIIHSLDFSPSILTGGWVLHIGSRLYFPRNNGPIVVDTRDHGVVETIRTGRSAQFLRLIGENIYAEGLLDVDVYDPHTLEIVRTLRWTQFSRADRESFQLMFQKAPDGRLTEVLDPETGGGITNLPGGHNPETAIRVRDFLYLTWGHSKRAGWIWAKPLRGGRMIKLAQSLDPSPPVTDGNYLYYANTKGTSITVIDTRTNSLLENIEMGDTPYSPLIIGRFMFVCVGTSSKLAVIDLATRRVIKTIPLRAQTTELLVVGRFLYVFSSASYLVTAIDISGFLGARGGSKALPS
jgi:YVTN family beta-propeller protein